MNPDNNIGERRNRQHPSNPQTPASQPHNRQPPLNRQPLTPLPDYRDNERINIDGVDVQMRPDGQLEPEGEDIMHNLEADYRRIAGLDEYDDEQLSQGDYDEMDFQTKRMADMQIENRARVDGNQIQAEGDGIFDDRSLNSFVMDDSLVASQMKRNREREFMQQLREGVNDEDQQMDQEDYEYFNKEDFKGNLANWIKDPKTVRFIRTAFRNFLKDFRNPESGQLVYEQRISYMCSNNRQSLEVDFSHLSDTVPVLSFWLFDSPALLIPYLNQVVYEVACRLFRNFGNIHKEVYVKIKNYPLEENLRDLKKDHLNSTVKFKALVTRRHPVTCQLKKIYYLCRCGDRKGPIYQNENQDLKLGNCHNCKSRGPFTIDKEKVEYRNHQKLIVQEMPSKVPPGRVARQKMIICLGDNIDAVRPGDQVEVTGFFNHKFDYVMTTKHGFPIFSTYVEANNLVKLSDIDELEFIEEKTQHERIIALSRLEDLSEIIFRSIAPNIYGHDHIKRSVALTLFGGTAIEQPSHRIRGDINLIMVGDAGMGKSQVLKFIQRVVPRTVYTTGKGASAVGLTASVRRDYVSGEWVLEGGALVLADQGICLIDEFDKMNEVDRTSIHEAMEQQTISISKAGIVANLKARCSVIAAANPIGGKYQKSMSFARNVNLSDPIISRFDVICVLHETVDRALDRRMGRFILGNHIRALTRKQLDIKEKEERLKTEAGNGQAEEQDKENILDELDDQSGKIKEEKTQKSNPNKSKKNPHDKYKITGGKISPEFLKLYIAYAKRFHQPRISQKYSKRIENFYLELRRKSRQYDGSNIVTRHLESLIRLSLASARMHLRNHVMPIDIDLAIKVLLESFIQTQKKNAQNHIRRQFGQYLRQKGDHVSLLRRILENSIREHAQLKSLASGNGVHLGNGFELTVEKLKEEAAKVNISDLGQLFESRYFEDSYVIRNQFIVPK